MVMDQIYTYYFFNEAAQSYEYTPKLYTLISYERTEMLDNDIRKHANIIKAQQNKYSIWLMDGGNIITTKTTGGLLATGTIKFLNESKEGLEGMIRKLDLDYDPSNIIAPKEHQPLQSIQ